MKKKIAFSTPLICFLLFSLFTLTGCQQVQVSQDYNLASRPSTMQSFNWYPGFLQEGGVQTQDPLLHDRYIRIIEEQLTAQGYSKSNDPDFLVSYQYQVKTKIHSTPSANYRISTGSGRRDNYWGIDSGSNIRQFDVAYLFIDFFNAGSKKAFWRGRGSAIATSHSSPEDLTRNIYKTVSEILQQSPTLK